MNQEFFTNLPSEIIINILSRLPVRTIISCKCVCKSWLDLVETHEFAKSHLSKSVPGLALYQQGLDSSLYKIFEFEDGLDLEHHELHYNPVANLNPPFQGWLRGSANGLLLVGNLGLGASGLCICNPITRDYINLRCPDELVYSNPLAETYAIGTSKMTGQLKVVRILSDAIYDRTGELLRLAKFECHVHTLGAGSWRSIDPGASFEFNSLSHSAFLNGNLHWLVYDLSGSPWISCFDLETEVFSTFSSPPLAGHAKHFGTVFTMRDCLCVFDNTFDGRIVIWLMKEYGVEKSWTMDFVISEIPNFSCQPRVVAYPIKGFKNGDILMAWEDLFLVYYSNKAKTIQKIDTIDVHSALCIDAILHTSSFFSVKSFGLEDVSSF